MAEIFGLEFTVGTAGDTPGIGEVCMADDDTTIVINDYAGGKGNPHVDAFMRTWVPEDNETAGHVLIISDRGVYRLYAVTGRVRESDLAEWTKFDVGLLEHAGQFNDGEAVLVEYTRMGNVGTEAVA